MVLPHFRKDVSLNPTSTVKKKKVEKKSGRGKQASGKPKN